MVKILSCVLPFSVLAGCATSFGILPSEEPGDVARREIVLETALGQIGRPYRYGGGDGEGFDCSGLVRHVYAEAGVSLPRTAAAQAREGAAESLDRAAVGDLVFFHIDGGNHVAVYVGEGRVVHAPAPGKTVSVTTLDTPYWRAHLWKVVRILP